MVITQMNVHIRECIRHFGNKLFFLFMQCMCESTVPVR